MPSEIPTDAADLISSHRLGSVLREGPHRRRELPTPAYPKSLRPRGLPRTSCSLTATVPPQPSSRLLLDASAYFTAFR